jgi:hypothetical protein
LYDVYFTLLQFYACKTPNTKHPSIALSVALLAVSGVAKATAWNLARVAILQTSKIVQDRARGASHFIHYSLRYAAGYDRYAFHLFISSRYFGCIHARVGAEKDLKKLTVAAMHSKYMQIS